MYGKSEVCWNLCAHPAGEFRTMFSHCSVLSVYSVVNCRFQDYNERVRGQITRTDALNQ